MDELLKTYGMEDITAKDVTQEKKEDMKKVLLDMLDKDSDGRISRDEWMDFCANKGILPDFGTGPGHHGDMEYEYEIHHWEK